MPNRKIKILRISSLFTLIAFSLQQLVLPPQARASEFAGIHIPANLGQMDPVKDAKIPGKIIFHIQDAHGNEDAQKNIQAILHLLTSQNSAKVILLEGGSGELHPELMHFFPKNPALNLKIADSLLKKAEFTGAERFLLERSLREGPKGRRRSSVRSEIALSPAEPHRNDIHSYGIENIPAYRKNRQAFQKVLRAREMTRTFLSALDDQIHRLSALHMNSLLGDFLQKAEDHETGLTDYLQWLQFLKTQAKKYLEINLEDPFYQREWPMLIRLFRLHVNESKIRQSAIAAEKEAFLGKLSALGIKDDMVKKTKNLFEKLEAVNETSSQFPLEEALQAFGELLEALPRNFSFKPYANLRLQIQSQIFKSELKNDLLFLETERLEALIIEKLTRNETEKKLVGLYKNYALLKKLFRLELTLKEYRAIIDSSSAKTNSSSPHVFRQGSSSGFPTKAFGNNGSLRPSLLIQQFLTLNSDSRVKSVSFSHLEEIDQLFDLALSFYSGARQRDTRMAKNTLEILRDLKEDSAILVTGGFHSQGMKKYFESKGFSYYLITPHIRELGDSKAYLTAMLAEKSQIALMSKLQPLETILAEAGPEYRKHIRKLIGAELRTLPSLSGINSKLLWNQYHLDISTAFDRTKARVATSERPDTGPETIQTARAELRAQDNYLSAKNTLLFKSNPSAQIHLQKSATFQTNLAMEVQYKKFFNREQRLENLPFFGDMPFAKATIDELILNALNALKSGDGNSDPAVQVQLDSYPEEVFKLTIRQNAMPEPDWNNLKQKLEDFDLHGFSSLIESHEKSLKKDPLYFQKGNGFYNLAKFMEKAPVVLIYSRDLKSGTALTELFFQRPAFARAEARSINLLSNTDRIAEAFWVKSHDEMLALSAREGDIHFPRIKENFSNGKILPAYGYSLVWFPDFRNGSEKSVADALADIQSRIEKKIGPENVLLVPKESLHLTVKGIEHRSARDPSANPVDTGKLLETVKQLAPGLAAIPHGQGILKGPFWDKDLGIVMIWEPDQADDPLSKVKAATEKTLSLEQSPRPFHLTLAYPHHGILQSPAFRDLYSKMESIPKQSIPLTIRQLEINGYGDIAFVQTTRSPAMILPLASQADKQMKVISEYEKILHARLNGLQEYPDPQGVSKILRGFEINPQGEYQTRRFEEGAYSSIVLVDNERIVDESRKAFESFLQEIAGVFPKEIQNQIKFWETQKENAHISVTVFQEPNILLDTPAPRLTEEDKPKLKQLLEDSVKNKAFIPLQKIGYGIGSDGGFVSLYTDPGGEFQNLRNRLSSESQKLTGGRTSSRPKSLISMTVGRILSLPYSNDPGLQAQQKAQVLKVIREQARLYQSRWQQNMNNAAFLPLEIQKLTWIHEMQWLTLQGPEKINYPLLFSRSEVRSVADAPDPAKNLGTWRSEVRTSYAVLESRAKGLALTFRRQKQAAQTHEKLNTLIREWIQLTPPVQKVSFSEKGLSGFKSAETGFSFWNNLASLIQDSSFEQKAAALSALEALLTATHLFYAQKAKQNERNRGERLFNYDHALQPLLVLKRLSSSAENLHDLAVNYFHLDELSRAEQISLGLLHQNDLSPALTRATNVLLGYIKVKKAWQYYRKARQITGNDAEMKIFYRQASDLARDGASIFNRILREYRQNPQDSRQIARAWTGLSSIERTSILSTRELLKTEKSRKTVASLELEITGRAVHSLHAAVQSLLTAKARGNNDSYQHSLAKSYLPLWEEDFALDKILAPFVRKGVGILEDHQIQTLQKNMDQLEILLNGKTLWNENYTPLVSASDPRVLHLVGQIQALRDWINFREEAKHKIILHAKGLVPGDYADIDTFKKELELFVVEDLEKSPVLAKIQELSSPGKNLSEFFQDVYAVFANLSLKELYVLKSAIQRSSQKKSALFHPEDMLEITKSTNEDLSLLIENYVPLTPEAAEQTIHTPFFKLAGFSVEQALTPQTLSSSIAEKQEIAPYSDKDVLMYGENDPKRFEAIVTLSEKLIPWTGPARSAAYQKIQFEAKKQLDFFLEEYQKWKKHSQADRKSPDRLTPDQARRVKEDLYNYRMDKGYYPLMMELERMQKNDLSFVQTYLQKGHSQGRDAGISLQRQEDTLPAGFAIPYYGFARIRHYQDFLKTFYQHTGFSWAAIAVQEMNEIEQTLLRIRDSDKDPDYLSFEVYQTEIQKANGIYMEVKNYQATNGAKIEKMLASVMELRETLGKARKLALAPGQKEIFANSLARLGTRTESVSLRLQNIPREPEYWDRTQEAKRMTEVSEKLLNQATFLLESSQRIHEWQKTLRSQKELLEQNGLMIESSENPPDKAWFQKTKKASENLSMAQKLFSNFQEERFDEKKTEIFRSKLNDLDQQIVPVLETLTKMMGEITAIKKELIFEETEKIIKLWNSFVSDFFLKVLPGKEFEKQLWQEFNEIHKILSGFTQEARNRDSLMESFFRLSDAIEKAIEIDDYQKIQAFRETTLKVIGNSPQLKEKIQAPLATLKKELSFSVKKTAYGMPQEPQITINPANIAPEDITLRAALINAAYALIGSKKILADWSSFDNEHFLRAYRHELLSFALAFSFYAQLLEGHHKGFSIPDSHAVLKKNFVLLFERQRDYLESKKGLAPSSLTAFDEVLERAKKQPLVPLDSHPPLAASREQQIEVFFDSFPPEEIFRRIDFTQSLIDNESSRREIPLKIVQELLAMDPRIDGDLFRHGIDDLKENNTPEAVGLFEKILALLAKYGIPLEPAAMNTLPFAKKIIEDILLELDRRQTEKNVETPPEFKVPVNASPETVEKLKTAVLLLEKGLPMEDNTIEEIIRMARVINPAFKTRFDTASRAATSPEDKMRLFLEIQRQVLFPLHLVVFDGKIWPVRAHTWKKHPGSYGQHWWSVEITAPPEAFSGFHVDTFFFLNPSGSRRASSNHFHEIWAVTGKPNSSPILKEKIRRLINLKEINKSNYYERLFWPHSLASAQKNIKNFTYTLLRQSGEIFPAEPFSEYATVSEILRKTSPLRASFSAPYPGQLSRTNKEVMPVLYFSGDMAVIISQIHEDLQRKDPAMAYLHFLIFLYDVFNIFENNSQDFLKISFLTLFKDLAQETGIPLENPDVLPTGERLKTLNTFTEAFLEKIENGEGIKGAHAPEQALQFLERIYAKHFWTEDERLERLNSRASHAEPAPEEISPAAAMLRETYQPPATSPETISGVIEILRIVSSGQKLFGPESLKTIDTHAKDIEKLSPAVDAVQASAIAKGMLRPFIFQKSKPDLPKEIEKLKTYSGIKLKILLTRIWATLFLFYLEAFQESDYREKEEPSDREILLQFARAVHPRLANIFQEFTDLMLQPQDGKTLDDLSPASTISKILAPWRNTSSGEIFQESIFSAFNHFLYPAGMLLVRLPSSKELNRFTPILYFSRPDSDLNLIQFGTHAHWTLVGNPVHYGTIETFPVPLIPGTALRKTTLLDSAQKSALWLKPVFFAGAGRESALKKMGEVLDHAFSEKMKQSSRLYSLDSRTITSLDSFFSALKKKVFNTASSAKSGEELVEKIIAHQIRSQTILGLYWNISQKQRWEKRFGMENKEVLGLLFFLIIAGRHFPSVAFDGFHDFLLLFTTHPAQNASLKLLNAILPETIPLSGESDPERQTEKLAEILINLDLEKLTPGLLRERALSFTLETFGENIFKDLEELYIRAPLAQITEQEKDEPPFIRSEARINEAAHKRRELIFELLQNARTPIHPRDILKALRQQSKKYRSMDSKKLYAAIFNDFRLDPKLKNHPMRSGRVDVKALLHQHGKEQLEGLNLKEAAKKLTISKTLLHDYFKNHPDEDMKKYGIITGKRPGYVKKPAYFTIAFTHEFFRAHFTHLNEDEIRVLNHRILTEKPKSLSKTGEAMDGISKERIQEIENSALKKAEEYYRFRYQKPLDLKNLGQEPFQKLAYFSVRSRSAFKKLGIQYVSDLIVHLPEDFLKLRNFGGTSLQEIRDVLLYYGLSLHTDDPSFRSEARSIAVNPPVLEELLKQSGGYKGLEGKKGVELGPGDRLSIIQNLRSHGINIEGVGQKLAPDTSYLHAVSDYNDYFSSSSHTNTLDFMLASSSLYFMPDHQDSAELYTNTIDQQMYNESLSFSLSEAEKRQKRIEIRYSPLVKALKSGGLIISTHFPGEEQDLLNSEEAARIGLDLKKRYQTEIESIRDSGAVVRMKITVSVMQKKGDIVRSEARVSMSSILALAAFLGNIIPSGTLAKEPELFTALFRKRLNIQKNASRQISLVTAAQDLSSTSGKIQGISVARLQSILSGDHAFAIISIPVPGSVSPSEIKQALKELQPFLAQHPRKLLVFAYDGNLSAEDKETIYLASGKKILFFKGDETTFSRFYSGRFSQMGENSKIAERLLQRAREITQAPATVVSLAPQSVVVSNERTFSGTLALIGKQFLNTPVKLLPEDRLIADTLYAFKAASVNAEKLKETLDELTIYNLSDVVRFGFESGMSAQIQSLVQAARHILQAA